MGFTRFSAASASLAVKEVFTAEGAEVSFTLSGGS